MHIAEHVRADHLGLGVAEAFDCLGYVGDAAAVICADDEVACVIDQGAEPGLAGFHGKLLLLECLCRLYSVRDIDQHHEERIDGACCSGHCLHIDVDPVEIAGRIDCGSCIAPSGL